MSRADGVVQSFARVSAASLELLALAVLLGGVALAGRAGMSEYRGRGAQHAYRTLRQWIGRGMLLALELLVAADIIRTVALEPTIQSVIVLAGIVLIRTFLSLSLEVEIEGRWPWRKSTGDAPG